MLNPLYVGWEVKNKLVPLAETFPCTKQKLAKIRFNFGNVKSLKKIVF